MNLVVYALAVLSNMLVILVMPDEMAPGFLKVYSLGSMAFGVMVVYAFSTPRLMPALQRGRFALTALVLCGEAAAWATGSVPGQALVYALGLLLSDYYVTQCGSARHVVIYRSFLIISVVPAILSETMPVLAINEAWRDLLLPMRTIGALACLLSLQWGGRPLDQLKVGNPFFYIVATHLLYFGSLTLMSWLLAGPALRAWYVGSQIGQGLVLKLMDYRIRRHASVNPIVSWSVHGISAIIGAGLVCLHWQPLALLAYAMAVLGLYGVSRLSKLT